MRPVTIARTLVLTLLATAATAAERFPTMASGQGRMACGSCSPPRTIPSRSVVVPTSEPGERLVISGDVYQPDGVTRASDIVLFLYQTDATGRYNQPDDSLNPRLYGWVRSDAAGHYEIDTIRPGSYPGQSIAAHIHAHAFGAERPEWYIDEFRFAGDPFLPAAQRSLPDTLGRLSPVVKLSRGADGVWRGIRDIRLEAPRR